MELKRLFTDPICALATARGVSAIATVRCSGERILERLLPLLERPDKPKPRRIYLTSFKAKGEFLDEILFVYFQAPASYTGEEMVELSFHGNPIIIDRAMEALLEAGFRQALPGEFTRRAVLNGKIDLPKAEAINAMITSRSETALDVARRSYVEGISKEISIFREEIIRLLATIEVELNYPDEVETDYKDLGEKLNDLSESISAFIESASKGLRIAQGIKTVIVGETNVGKSTLLNALLRRDRAIVSDIPGTTRDTIEEDLSINGVLFRVIDTAGIRASNDAIEEMGIQRSLKAIEDADLLILLSDPAGDPGYLQKIDLEGKRMIRAANKSDIRQIDGAGYDVVISARTGQGLASLEKLMVEKTVDLTSIGEQIIVSARQRVCLQECLRYLHQSLEAIEERVTIDIVSTLVESAAKSLDELLGRNLTEDLLDRIFSDFCVGK